MINLSANALNVLKDCPRCFYLDRKLKITRPRGNFPSLPGGVDTQLKIAHDVLRMAGERPYQFNNFPELNGFALYPFVDNLNKWRHWKSGLKVVGKDWTLIGSLDDLLHNLETDLYAPFDYKSKGKACDAEYLQKYYQLQLDIYELMLQENGMKPAGFGVFSVYYPDECRGTVLVMAQQSFVVSTDAMRAKKAIADAMDCLASLRAPIPNNDCEYCQYTSKLEAVA